MIFMRCIKPLLLSLILYCLVTVFFACATRTKAPVVLENTDTAESQEPSIKPEMLPAGAEAELTEHIEAEAEAVIPKEYRIRLTFAGDIMAHSNVTRMTDFSLIYADIVSITLSDDLTFANLETPVHEDRPYENYPTFNVKQGFVEAAVEGGFDVFSLANNHTNDQGKSGIHKTHEYFSLLRKNDIYSAGIKTDTSIELTYEIIEKNGFVLLFAAFTEILNSSSYKDYIDYFTTSNSSREILKQQLISIREKHPCDLFILSIHTFEPEYVIEVTKSRKTFYYDLLECGIDIVWANHPHVMREWELVEDSQTGLLTKAVFYGMGNTISGQRYVYNFDNPSAIREYTGDSMLFQLEFVKKDDVKPSISKTQQYLITTHIDSHKNSLIKIMTQEFIDSQDIQYKNYYTKRLELLKKIKGTTLCP